MTWLLWREYRLNRFVLAAGAVLVILPYVIAALCLPIEGAESTELFIGAWIWGGFFSVLSVALLGGNVIAGERADRSAEFVAYLPLERWQMLAGKLLFCLTAIAVIWTIHLLIRTVLLSDQPAADIRWLTICFGVTFGASWLCSSLQLSPAVASAMGFGANIVIWGCIAAISMTVEQTDGYTPDLIERHVAHILVRYAIIGLPFSAVCFSLGTWNYLRRSEP